MLLAVLASSLQAEEIPEAVQAIIAESCLECHDADTEKGEVNLERSAIDWAQAADQDLWLRVLTALDQGQMPPPDEKPLSDEARETVMAYLDTKTLAHTPIGGTLPRRLNRAEYAATIRSLLFLPSFTLPDGFPKDSVHHGFDNLGEGLALSPAHLNAYAASASAIADEVFPPKKAMPKKQIWDAGPEDMVLSFSAAGVHGDALRLASRSVDVMRSCSWPSRIEIRDSGTYRISVEASKFLSDSGPAFDQPMILEVYARALAASDRSTVNDFRLIKEIQVTREAAEKTAFKADLYEGETILFRWKNAMMTHDEPHVSEAFQALSADDPRFLAGWLKVIFPKGDPKKPRSLPPLRGRNGWNLLVAQMEDPKLDLSHATVDSEMAQAFFRLAEGGRPSIADSLCYFYHTPGPAMEIHGLRIVGPLKLVESPADLKRRERQLKITGTPHEGQSDEEFARAMLSNFLPRAFRKSVSPETIDSFLSIAVNHWQAGHSFEEGMHLLLRSILISPRFLYRCIGGSPRISSSPLRPVSSDAFRPDVARRSSGYDLAIAETKHASKSLDLAMPGAAPQTARKMDDFDLATRLSYFLTQGPPDATLIDLAQRQRLAITDKSGEFWVIRREAERLLPSTHTAPMIQSFVGQWLGTRTLHGIMPDPEFRFDENSVDIAKYETEQFFTEMLTENRPMTDFIDPDFTYSSVAFIQRNYGFTPPFALKKGDKLSSKEKHRLRRIGIDRGGRYGGLLGQSAILMATANGVDTQPVIRGVWMLENILGMPPPEPPKNVPALTPDTRGTTSPREQLAAHTDEPACASCHQRIDPLGLMLENFDPVGRWRSKWPGTETTIDASGQLPDGTEIKDVVAFKAWLVDNIDLFSTCVAEKLMTYATGRVLNYTEKHEIERIVKANHAAGNGFRDLLLALLESETFRTQ